MRDSNDGWKTTSSLDVFFIPFKSIACIMAAGATMHDVENAYLSKVVPLTNKQRCHSIPHRYISINIIITSYALLSTYFHFTKIRAAFWVKLI